MTPDGGQAAADITYGIDIGGTKVLGVALDGSDAIVAEARVATPKGTRNIVGSHVAAAVAEVVGGLDRALAGTAPSSASTPAPTPTPVGVGAPGMVDRGGGSASPPTCPRPRASTGTT